MVTFSFFILLKKMDTKYNLKIFAMTKTVVNQQKPIQVSSCYWLSSVGNSSEIKDVIFQKHL